MSSGPQDLLMLSWRISLLTSSSVMGKFVIVFSVLLSMEGSSPSCSSVKTLQNCSWSISAFSLSSNLSEFGLSFSRSSGDIPLFVRSLLLTYFQKGLGFLLQSDAIDFSNDRLDLRIICLTFLRALLYVSRVTDKLPLLLLRIQRRWMLCFSFIAI